MDNWSLDIESDLNCCVDDYMNVGSDLLKEIKKIKHKFNQSKAKVNQNMTWNSC